MYLLTGVPPLVVGNLALNPALVIRYAQLGQSSDVGSSHIEAATRGTASPPTMADS